MARNDPQVNLRFPAGLKQRLDEAAARNKRSLTAEMTARLEASFDLESVPGQLDSLADVLVSRTSDLYRFLLERMEEQHQAIRADLAEMKTEKRVTLSHDEMAQLFQRMADQAQASRVKGPAKPGVRQIRGAAVKKPAK